MNATEENVFAAVLEEVMADHEIESLAELSERTRAAGYLHQDLDYWLARTHPDAREFFATDEIDMTLVASLEKALELSDPEADRLAIVYVRNKDIAG